MENKHIYLVAKVFDLVSNIIRQTVIKDDYNWDNVLGGSILQYEELEIDLFFCHNYKKLFENYTLGQLRDLLYMIIPHTINICQSHPVNVIGQVKLAIKYIEQEISSLKI
ncbi:MAG TPA: hypothetical protein VKR58_00740 [Aquella sp.]|nr:hypothetical protein [Aquella sp.]